VAAESLLIFGASARAAAFSTLRAGLRPWCADLFADADLQARCPAVRLPGKYPDGFLDLLATELPGPWLYTGGLENHPALVGRMERRRALWGNGESALRRARDPEFLVRAARRAKVPAPAVSREAWRRPGPGRWLIKPLHGAGGSGIRPWTPQDGARLLPFSPFYLQQHVEGETASALYVGDGRSARLLGLTRQLVGEDWLRAAPFRYCGSVGPLEPDDALRESLERLGRTLAYGAVLRGLFGVDGLLRDGAFWPVEVNPRYTASVEVLEHATGLRALAWHRRAFVGGPGEDAPEDPPPRPARFVGKAILYAPQDGTFPAEGPWLAALRAPAPPDEMPSFADVPHAGEEFAAGRPVLTLFARADTVPACIDALRRRAAEVERWLYPGGVLG
jgi:predicted ATP-grasp superfamily ATP-dependent carboligase